MTTSYGLQANTMSPKNSASQFLRLMHYSQQHGCVRTQPAFRQYEEKIETILYLPFNTQVYFIP